jgi:hypothetical protein
MVRKVKSIMNVHNPLTRHSASDALLGSSRAHPVVVELTLVHFCAAELDVDGASSAGRGKRRIAIITRSSIIQEIRVVNLTKGEMSFTLFNIQYPQHSL